MAAESVEQESNVIRIDIARDQINLPKRGGGTIYYDKVRVRESKDQHR